MSPTSSFPQTSTTKKVENASPIGSTPPASSHRPEPTTGHSYQPQTVSTRSTAQRRLCPRKPFRSKVADTLSRLRPTSEGANSRLVSSRSPQQASLHFRRCASHQFRGDSKHNNPVCYTGQDYQSASSASPHRTPSEGGRFITTTTNSPISLPAVTDQQRNGNPHQRLHLTKTAARNDAAAKKATTVANNNANAPPPLQHPIASPNPTNLRRCRHTQHSASR